MHVHRHLWATGLPAVLPCCLPAPKKHRFCLSNDVILLQLSTILGDLAWARQKRAVSPLRFSALLPRPSQVVPISISPPSSFLMIPGLPNDRNPRMVSCSAMLAVVLFGVLMQHVVSAQNGKTHLEFMHWCRLPLSSERCELVLNWSFEWLWWVVWRNASLLFERGRCSCSLQWFIIFLRRARFSVLLRLM